MTISLYYKTIINLMKEVLIMNVIKQMEYTNKMGESLEKLADGVVNGFRFVILSNGVFPIVRIYCDARSQYGEAFQGLATDRAFTSTLMNKRRPRTEVAKSKMGYSMQWNFNKIGDYVGDKEETFVTGRVWNVPDLYAFVVDATEKITLALSGKDINDVDLGAFENVVGRVNKSLKAITGNSEELDVSVDDGSKYSVSYRGYNVVWGNVRTVYNTLMSISSILFSVVKANGLYKVNKEDIKVEAEEEAEAEESVENNEIEESAFVNNENTDIKEAVTEVIEELAADESAADESAADESAADESAADESAAE